MNIPHNKFCILPWISLEASPIGTVRPCCLAEEEIVDNTGKKFNLSHAQFIEVQESNYLKRLRQDFLDKKQPDTCKKCWREENAGRTSKRMHTLDRLKSLDLQDIWTVDAKPLVFLDLKLGNICNLKCRICGSWSSSTFAAEELKFLRHNEDKKNNHHYLMLKSGSWPKESKIFWQQIDSVINQIRYIEFTGGEPFMIQEHFEMLQTLVDKDLAKNIEIHYNTNGTQWPENAESIWKHFKLVEIAFSIDDVESRFEYQRTNAKWTDVCTNIKKFHDLRQKYSNIELQVCCTVNVFNVYYLDAVGSWIENQNFDFVYWNMMHEAYYFSINTLPVSAKQAISHKLQQASVSVKMKNEFLRIIDFMFAGDSLDGKLLCEKIKELDLKRQQNLCLVEPEFAKIIDYDITKPT